MMSLLKSFKAKLFFFNLKIKPNASHSLPLHSSALRRTHRPFFTIFFTLLHHFYSSLITIFILLHRASLYWGLVSSVYKMLLLNTIIVISNSLMVMLLAYCYSCQWFNTFCLQFCFPFFKLFGHIFHS